MRIIDVIKNAKYFILHTIHRLDDIRKDYMTNIKNEKSYGKLNYSVEEPQLYREFKTCEEAQAWGFSYYNEWALHYKEVTLQSSYFLKAEFYAQPLEQYCGHLYKSINNFLRKDRDNTYYTNREFADILSLVLCTAPRIPFDLNVYRMVSDVFIEMLVEQNKRSYAIQENGFMSTSLLKDIVNVQEPYAKEKNLLKIYVPKGTIGVYVNSVTKRNEEEMLLPTKLGLGLVSYPYEDVETGKIIWECKLLDYSTLRNVKLS